MAYQFNGTDQYLSVATAVATAPPIAMSAWFKTTNLADRGTIVSISRVLSGGAPNYFALETGGDLAGDPLLATARRNQEFSAESASGFSSGIWHHGLAVFYSATDRRVWLDGGSEGQNTNDKSPVDVGATCIAAINERDTFINHIDGQLAEVAIWAGSGVEEVGAEEAACLAMGMSPLCLRRQLGNLTLYQDLIRPLNRPGAGPEMSAANGPSVVSHPRAIYPTSQRLGTLLPHVFVAPYRTSGGESSGSHAPSGAAAVPGTLVGATAPLGEVSA